MMSTLLATEVKTGKTEKPLTGGRIPALDGWRGIAILLVLFDHIQFAQLHRRYARPWMQTGQHGVIIFFVLSGFLITWKLVEAPIDLKHFYIRRFLRLMPAAWTYLAVLLLLHRLTRASFTSLPEVYACVFFYRNMVNVSGGGLAGHFWSLSLEEQFYLVWPCLLLLSGIRRCRWIATIGACACAVFRWFLWSHYDQPGPNYMSQVRADALLVGCLTALLLSDPQVRLTAIRVCRTLVLPAVAMLLYCMTRFHWLPPLREGVSVSILIAACVLYPQSIVCRILSFAPLAWLGAISYSVYLWQELFVQIGSGRVNLYFICIGIPVFSLGSYYFIERPCIRLSPSTPSRA
jgi:peptidoglycan/LPS O-acetylase OafA/YrhL